MRILNSELADTLGNLLSRGCAKTVNKRQVFPRFDANVFHGELMQLQVTQKLVSLLDELPDKCYAHYKAYNFYLAVDQIVEVLHTTNNFFETTKPWMLAKNGEHARLDAVLFVTLETLRICGIVLQPIVPQLSKQLLDKLRIKSDDRMWSNALQPRWKSGAASTSDEYALCSETDAILFRRIRLESSEKETKKRAQK